MSPLEYSIGNLFGDIKVALRIFEDVQSGRPSTISMASALKSIRSHIDNIENIMEPAYKGTETASLAYYIGTHPGCFRRNQAAEILGVRMKVTKDLTQPCPCFMIMFPDGLIYYPPLSEGDYTIQQRPY